MKLSITLEKPDGEVVDRLEIPSSIYLSYTTQELQDVLSGFMEDNEIRSKA